MQKLNLLATDLQENQTRQCDLQNAVDDAAQIFLVRRDGNIYAYLNSCPHTGVPLNWQDDVFLDMEHFYIQCSVHGALFQVEDGLCVRGPCAGQSLQAVNIRIDNDELFVDL